jgi:hypothetical protein
MTAVRRVWSPRDARDAAIAAAAVDAKGKPKRCPECVAMLRGRKGGRHRATGGPITHLRFIEGRQVRMVLPGVWPPGSPAARVSAAIEDIRRSL